MPTCRAQAVILRSPCPKPMLHPYSNVHLHNPLLHMTVLMVGFGPQADGDSPAQRTPICSSCPTLVPTRSTSSSATSSRQPGECWLQSEQRRAVPNSARAVFALGVLETALAGILRRPHVTDSTSVDFTAVLRLTGYNTMPVQRPFAISTLADTAMCGTRLEALTTRPDIWPAARPVSDVVVWLRRRWGTEMGEVGEGTTVAVWYALASASPSAQ